jgi:chromosome segregation ATPase
MLTLLLVSLYEFKLFLQIVLWIAIPCTIIAVVVTTILHYRRKKALLNEPEPELADGRLYLAGDTDELPDWLASGNPDNTSLLKKYEREVRRYKGNYATLEQDYRALEEKYTDLLNKAYHNDQPDHAASEQLQQEIKQYKLKIAQLQQALDYHEQKNNSENGENNVDNDLMELHDLRIKYAQLEEENTELKEKLEETQFLQDLLEEKKKQTDFLQQQLEMRIRSYHQLEKQTSSAVAELAQWRTAASEFDSKEQALLADLEQKQEAICQQAEHIQQLESTLEELHRQQASLQSIIDEKQAAIQQLQNDLHQEQEKVKDLEGKLELSNQLFARIYAELSKSMDAGLASHANGTGLLDPASTAN